MTNDLQPCPGCGRLYPRTEVGVAELIEAAGGPLFGERARAWAEAVWRAWASHHAVIRAEAEAALTSH